MLTGRIRGQERDVTTYARYDDVSAEDSEAAMLAARADVTLGVLGPVSAFVRDWHAGPWGAWALPRDVGARLIVHGCDPTLLGVAATVRGVSTIGLNARVLDTPLHVPTLVHEAAHILQGVDGVAFCSNSWVANRAERDAWLGAALLAIPCDHARDVDAGQADVSEVAEACGVPEAMVLLRVALGRRYGSAEGRGNHRIADLAIRQARADLARWVSRQSARLQGG